jgi:uncharacterized protein YjiS (DUF1127 family)
MVVAIGNSIEASAKARAKRETVRILRGLDDRMLKDIGIDRSEIDGLVLGAGGKTSRRS